MGDSSLRAESLLSKKVLFNLPSCLNVCVKMWGHCPIYSHPSLSS